jgi:hypothetical protein
MGASESTDQTTAVSSPATGGDPKAALAVGFAAGLRELRDRAGRPSYRQLAKVAHYSHTALSQAASGRDLPSLAVTLAFVRACGGDQDDWTTRWRQVSQAGQAAPALDDAADTPLPDPSPPQPAKQVSRWRAAAGRVPVRMRVVAAVGLAVAAGIVSVALLWSGGMATGTSQPGPVKSRLQMQETGLYVRAVVVTNLGRQAAYAYVLNAGDGKVHRSPQPVPPNQSWQYHFGRNLKAGARICGWVASGPATCSVVRA